MYQAVQSAGGSFIKRFQQLFQSPCSDNSKGDELCICVCEAVTPVLRYCQLFGISPISLHRSSNHENQTRKSRKVQSESHYVPADIIDDAETRRHKGSIENVQLTNKNSKCFISSDWKSVPSLINILMLFSFVSVTIWMYFRIQDVLKVYFDGTDLYTFGTQTLCLYSQCDLILIISLLQKDKFCEIWELLIKVLKNLTSVPKYPIDNSSCCISKIFQSASAIPDCTIEAVMQTLGQARKSKCKCLFQSLQVEFGHKLNAKKENKFGKRLRYLRLFAFCAVTIALILSVCHTISFINLVFHGCFDKSLNSTQEIGDIIVTGRPPCPFSNVFLFLQKLFYGMIDFVQQGAAILFGTLCLIIYIFFEEIEDQLESILEDVYNIKSTGVQYQYLIENLRITYEDLSRCCRLMSKYFGLTVLAVSITSVISITCALYSFTLYSGAIEKEVTNKIARYYVIWAFHGWFGFFTLTLMLVPGQMITNASDAPSQVIGRYALSQLDSETKFQLTQFQHQTRHSVVLTACNITNIGLGFIAAAATNVTTYILVILQFRLGVEK